MKESIYKNYDELPLFLNAATVAKVLGIAPSSSSGTNRSRTSNWQRPPTTVLKSCIGTALFLRNGGTK